MAATLRANTARAILAIASLFLPGLAMANSVPLPAGPCAAWMKRTIDKMKKLPERKWRDTIVAALGDGACPLVPESLRNASREVRRSRQTAASDRLLADAATRVLGPKCSVPNPAEDARALAKICPLPSKEELDLADSVFRDIRAVDYVLIDALATSLLSSQAYDATAQRLMLNFLLSATLLGEHRSRPSGAPGPGSSPSGK